MEIKFNCSDSSCRQRISVDERMANQLVRCPACSLEQKIPGSTEIRFYCSNIKCDQCIVIDVAEAGRFIFCPSCNKPLRVPGSPPRTLLLTSSQKAKVHKAKRGETTVIEINRIMPRYLSGFLLTTLVLVVMSSLRFYEIRLHPADAAEIALELSSFTTFRSPPAPDHAGDKLLYTKTTRSGVGIYLLNLTDNQELLVHEQYQKDYSVSKFRILGWAPDDSQFAYISGTLRGQTQITVCNSFGKQTGYVFVSKNVQSFAWLSSQSLTYMSSPKRDLLIFEQKPDGAWKQTQLFKGIANTNFVQETLMPISFNSVIWQEGNNLINFVFSSNAPVKIWESTSNKLEAFYCSPETKDVLLTCGDKFGDSLFKLTLPDIFKPGSSSDLGRISHLENSVTNAMWINGEKEIAWMQNELGQGTIFLRTNCTAEPIEIFQRGSVYRFEKGRRNLLITYWPADQLPQIWAYDTSTLSSNILFSNDHQHLRFAKYIGASTSIITNSAGRVITYHLWPSQQYLKNQKSLLLINQTPYSWNLWEETLANCGANVVSIDRPTWDSSEIDHWETDVLDVYHELAKDPRIDTNSVFLYAKSSETKPLSLLLADSKVSWRGAIFFNPEFFPTEEITKVHVAKILIDSGADDDNRHDVSRYLESAVEAGIPTTLVLHKDAGHTYNSSSTEQEQIKTTLKFIFGS